MHIPNRVGSEAKSYHWKSTQVDWSKGFNRLVAISMVELNTKDLVYSKFQHVERTESVALLVRARHQIHNSPVMPMRLTGRGVDLYGRDKVSLPSSRGHCVRRSTDHQLGVIFHTPKYTSTSLTQSSNFASSALEDVKRMKLCSWDAITATSKLEASAET